MPIQASIYTWEKILKLKEEKLRAHWMKWQTQMEQERSAGIQLHEQIEREHAKDLDHSPLFPVWRRIQEAHVFHLKWKFQKHVEAFLASKQSMEKAKEQWVQVRVQEKALEQWLDRKLQEEDLLRARNEQKMIDDYALIQEELESAS